MHLEQAVLDGRRRIVEGHQVIDPLDQGIALGQFLFGKILGVAVTAGLDHLRPFHVELLGSQASYLRIGDQVKPCRGLAFRIQHTQGLEDGYPVCPPLLTLSRVGRQAVGAHSQESPGRSHFMITVGHVAVLAGRRSRTRR